MYYYALFCAYSLSMVIVFGSDEFYVVTPLLIACYMALLLLPASIAVLLIREGSTGIAIAIIHFALAVIIHPAGLRTQESNFLDHAEQSRMLGIINRTHETFSAGTRMKMSRELAVSLATNAYENNKIDSPLWYWMYPPSCVFVFWGLVALVRHKDFEKETDPVA